MSIDAKPWTENDKILYLNQDDWITKYNQAGKIMASAADYYQSVKSDEAVASIQKDFNLGVVTGTRIIYNNDNLEGRIVHYFGSKIVEPVERTVHIPDYSNSMTLENCLDTEQGMIFLQALFLTNEDKETIIDNLVRLSNKSKDKINIWTPSQDGRKDNRERAVSLYYNNSDFLIIDNLNILSNGCSLSVAASAASLEARSVKNTQKNSNLPFNLESSIDKKNKSVCFSNMQAIGNFNKYTAMFCFHEKRYVISSIFDIGEVPNINERIANVLSKEKSTAKKLEEVANFLNPVCAHLALYANGKQLDDVEYFEDMEIKK